MDMHRRTRHRGAGDTAPASRMRVVALPSRAPAPRPAASAARRDGLAQARCVPLLCRRAAATFALMLIAACHTGPEQSTHDAAPAQRAAPRTAATAPDPGQVEFERRWVPYPSIGGQWGRGPLSSAESCAACHPGGGRGSLQFTPDKAGASVRLGQRDSGRPDPRYGRQLDVEGLLGSVPAEGEVRIEWRHRLVVLADGESVSLRAPVVRIEPAYGPLSPDTVVSLRVAPALHGLGLLERVALPASAGDAGSSAQTDSGIHNHVPDLERRETRVGRFGWKAGQPNLRQQAAAAFIDDIGVTTDLHGADNCTAAQAACQATETVPHPEAKPAQLDALTAYLRALPPPPAAPRDAHGSALFSRLRCDRCHQPSLRTGQHDRPVIHPYTDLKLHDMGVLLADGLGEHQAGGAHWRTAPLWGLSRIVPDADGLRLLHDGRARNVQEAILWHGGDAAAARDAYARLPRAARDALLRFLTTR